MKALIYKEMKFAPKGLFLFWLLGAMVLIPNYPKIVSAFYAPWAIAIYLQVKKENRDFDFCTFLPISERASVGATVFFSVLLEIGQMLSIAFFGIFCNLYIEPQGTLIGLDLNIAYFGIVLLTFAVYNVILFPIFYRTDYKISWGMICATTAFLALYGAFEFCINLIPGWKSMLDSTSAATFGFQSIVLVLGICLYALSVWFAYHKSYKIRNAR